MKAFSLRGIDDELDIKLKEEALKENKSVNQLVLTILKEALGLKKKEPFKEYRDLDSLAGTWTEEEGRSFTEAISDFNSIDKGMWE